MIPFGPWLPDQPSYRPEVASDVLNVIPHQGGYHPWKSFVGVIEALPEGQNPLTFHFYISLSGIVFNVLGTATKLYVLNGTGTAWDEVTRAGGDYATPNEGAWTFAQFDNFVFGVNGFDTSQMLDITGVTDFVDTVYPAGPPIAKFITTIRRFVVAANTSVNARAVAWSGLSEPLLWSPDPVTLADSQVLPTLGDITGLTGGDYGVVFQQHGIQRMVFAGPPTIFDFEIISRTMGVTASRTIAQYGDVVFFFSTSGVKLIRGAQEISDIGEAKIDTWLFDNVDEADLWRATGTVDIDNKLYLLSVPINDIEPLADLILAYHWPTGEWSKIAFTNHLIGQMIPQQSYNLDTIDTLIGDNLDSMNYSLDSPSLISTKKLRIAAFNAGRELGHFMGELMPATMSTGDIPLSQGRKSIIRNLRPMFEGPVIDPTLTPYVRDMLNDVPVPKATANINRNGKFPLRANGRYHRFQLDTAAGGSWKFALGLDDVALSEMAP